MIQLAAQTGQDPSTGEFFLDMRELWDGLLRAYDIEVDDIILDSKDIAKKIKKSQKAQWAGMSADPLAAMGGVASNPDSMGEAPTEQIPEQSQILQDAYQS